MSNDIGAIKQSTTRIDTTILRAPKATYMQDLLVPLYNLPQPPSPLSDITVRSVFSAESERATAWVKQNFGQGWASEFKYAANQSPVSAYLAIKDKSILGFACFNTAAKGCFGPTGTLESARGQGIGTQLLFRALQDMRAQGFAYAVIAAAGPVEYYERLVGAVQFEGGAPGFLGSITPKED